MGGVILGILAVAISAPLFIMAGKYLKKDKDFLYFLCALVGAVFLVGGLGIAIVAPTYNEVHTPASNVEISFTRVVPVNGYYLYEGKYVLEDNTRGTYGNETLEVSQLSPTAEVCLETKTTYKNANFWHSNKKRIETFIVFKNKE
jgi:hypothetical protein